MLPIPTSAQPNPSAAGLRIRSYTRIVTVVAVSHTSAWSKSAQFGMPPTPATRITSESGVDDGSRTHGACSNWTR